MNRNQLRFCYVEDEVSYGSVVVELGFWQKWVSFLDSWQKQPIKKFRIRKKIVLARGHIPTISLKVWLSMCIKYKVFCCQMCSSKGSQDDNLDSWGGKMKFYPLSVELHNFYCSTQYFWSSDRETLFAWQGLFKYQGDSGSIFWWW